MLRVNMVQIKTVAFSFSLQNSIVQSHGSTKIRGESRYIRAVPSKNVSSSMRQMYRFTQLMRTLIQAFTLY